ncbi:MAG: hypothetical protein NTV49_01250 [Kiritimatiellaeota bacterium]|nr:hypothetical protein [Kiritimatiellota bacterium]
MASNGAYAVIAQLPVATLPYTNSGVTVTNGCLYWYIVAVTNSSSSKNLVAKSARPLPATAPTPALATGTGWFSLLSRAWSTTLSTQQAFTKATPIRQ